MNILLTCGLFMMGLLSSTDWFRLMPEHKTQESQKVQCLANCTCMIAHKGVHASERSCRDAVLRYPAATSGQHIGSADGQAGNVQVISLLYKKDNQQTTPMQPETVADLS
jgi:hypothetical protein